MSQNFRFLALCRQHDLNTALQVSFINSAFARHLFGMRIKVRHYEKAGNRSLFSVVRVAGVALGFNAPLLPNKIDELAQLLVCKRRHQRSAGNTVMLEKKFRIPAQTGNMTHSA